MALPDAFSHLLDATAYRHPVGPVRLIETHISWVLVAGDYAYKIKKPVDFGFLDFSTPDKRRFCCDEEIRLNRRLAPAIYLDVVAVTATGLGDEGAPIDWAVRMRAFPADATLDRDSPIGEARIDAIADRVAAFHAEIPAAAPDSPFGSPAAVMHPVRENFRQLHEQAMAADELSLLERLDAWSEAEGRRLSGHFAARKAEGHVRECHGDLHLGNIAWVAEAPLIFDCIEFNANLRFVDVVSEMAFLCMDLIARGMPSLAWRCLNHYLERTGDYDGLAAYRFYLVYRAMVRAKVAGLRAGQGDAEAGRERLRYLELADRLRQPAAPGLLLMHGYSGSGKTWLSQRLLEGMGAIRLRSDVERKRLFNLAALADSREHVENIYSAEASRQTFDRLAELSGTLIETGYPVIVDATFLGRRIRRQFADLAQTRRCPWYLVSPTTDEATLRARIRARLARADDASEADLAVLDSQIAHAEPLAPEEAAHQLAWSEGEPIGRLLDQLSVRQATG